MGIDEESRNHKLNELNQQLEEVKKLQPQALPETKGSSDAAKGAIDFASATAVGTLLGYLADRQLGTFPWGLLVGLLLGTAAGLKLMFQAEAALRKSETKKEKTNAQD